MESGLGSQTIAEFFKGLCGMWITRTSNRLVQEDTLFDTRVRKRNPENTDNGKTTQRTSMRQPNPNWKEEADEAYRETATPLGELSVQIKCVFDKFDRNIGQAIKSMKAFSRSIKLLREKGPRGTRKKKIRWMQ